VDRAPDSGSGCASSILARGTISKTLRVLDIKGFAAFLRYSLFFSKSDKIG
jgi:hypothetical protein